MTQISQPQTFTKKKEKRKREEEGNACYYHTYVCVNGTYVFLNATINVKPNNFFR